MRRALSLAAIALVAGAAGCAHQEPARAAAPPRAVAPTGPSLVCPTRLPGSQVSVEDVPNGVAIGLTAPPERVDVVRAIAHVIAARYNHRDEVAGMEEDDPGRDQGGSGMGGSGSDDPDRPPPATRPRGTRAPPEAIPPSRAIAQDMHAGARLLFLANDPSQTPALRRDVRRHVARVRAGACWTKPPSG